MLGLTHLRELEQRVSGCEDCRRVVGAERAVCVEGGISHIAAFCGVIARDRAGVGEGRFCFQRDSVAVDRDGIGGGDTDRCG